MQVQSTSVAIPQPSPKTTTPSATPSDVRASGVVLPLIGGTEPKRSQPRLSTSSQSILPQFKRLERSAQAADSISARTLSPNNIETKLKPEVRGSTSVVVFKWEKAWLCLTPAAAEAFMPGILAAAQTPGRNGLATNLSQIEDTPSETEGNAIENSSVLGTVVPVDPSTHYILWNNKEGICRVTHLSALTSGWKRFKPKYTFLSQHNQDGLFDKLYMDIFQKSNKNFNLIGAVDSCSTASRSIEQRMLIIHKLNVPEFLHASLSRVTAQELEERNKRRNAQKL